MKQCPTCREEFDDELKFCTYDGSVLRGAGARRTANAASPVRETPVTRTYRSQRESSRDESAVNRWKIAFFALLVAAIGGNGAFIYFYILKPDQIRVVESRDVRPQAADVAAIAGPPKPGSPSVRPSIAEMSREKLIEALPKNLLRRFHAAESSQGSPDDLRVIKDDSGEYVVLIGAGRGETASRGPAERLLVLKSDGEEFKDITRQALPRQYGDGIVAGHRAEVSFDDTSIRLALRETASSKSIVFECDQCDHAYQEVSLEWKGSRYVEAARSWENDPYTVFYVVADALEKRRVDARARPLIDKSLDSQVAQGFARSGKNGWTVEWQGGDQGEEAEFVLSNGTDRLAIKVAKLRGQWRAVKIEEL